MIELISPLTLKERLPLSLSQKEKILSFRQQLELFSKTRERLLILVGPCSVHNSHSLLVYAKKLKELSDKTQSSCFIILRAYIEKPRTSLGWKGFLHQPSLEQSPNFQEGLFAARKLFLELTDLGLPLAMEFVDPLFAYYFDDLIAWGCIGARTSSSQPHRQLTSFLPFPVGFKNSVNGNIDVAIQGMLVASHPQIFLGINSRGYVSEIHSKGNSCMHLVLRGSDIATNYDDFSLQESLKKLALASLPLNIVIDCSHGNSKKNLNKQKEIFIELIEKIVENKSPIIGIMLESFLKEGCQKTSSTIDPSLSITDPCFSWETTEKLLLWAHHTLSTNSNLDLYRSN